MVVADHPTEVHRSAAQALAQWNNPMPGFKRAGGGLGQERPAHSPAPVCAVGIR